MKTENRLILGITTLTVVIVAVISIFGMILYNDSPQILQGEIECTQVKISGKLLGRIEKFHVQEGDAVKAGDTLVLINSPETNALMQSASAMKDAAFYQQRKVDSGAREQIIESLRQAWLAAQSQATLASSTYERSERLFADSVVTLQGKEESQALAQTAIAAEQAAHILLCCTPAIVRAAADICIAAAHSDGHAVLLCALYCLVIGTVNTDNTGAVITVKDHNCAAVQHHLHVGFGVEGAHIYLAQVSGQTGKAVGIDACKSEWVTTLAIVSASSSE